MAAFILFLAAPSVFAQTTSVILGTVKDASGGVVAGATVTVTNVDTSVSRTTTTGQDGAYRVPALLPGRYSVKVEKDGFKTVTQSGVTLDVAQELAVNVGLEVGASAQQVVVTGEAPLVDTSTSALGGLVDDVKVAELPLNGRNYIDLTLMQAGVSKNVNTAGVGAMLGTTFSSNGAPITSNNFLLDNTSIVNPTNWGPSSLAGTTLGLDGIKEYKIITDAYSAEFGMTMGSQMLLVSKGGTNQFHGDAFGYLRNNVLDARNYFDYGYLLDGKRNPLFQRSNFGGAFGGPIKKDKTFFFAAYEGIKQNLGATVLDVIPPAGCHAAAGTMLSNAQCSLITAAEGTVTVSAINANLQNLYPAMPNLTSSNLGGNNSGNFTFPTTAYTDVDYGQMRVDHNFSDKDSLFARYTIDSSSYNGPFSGPTAFSGTAFPQERYLDGSRDQFLTISENHIFSPTLLNTARISFSRSGFNSDPDKVYTIPNLPILVAGQPDFGTLNIGGVTTVGVANPMLLNYHIQNTYTASDDLYYTKGKHGLKFGVLWNRIESAVSSPVTSQQGTIYFADYAHFLEAEPNKYILTDPGANYIRDYRFYTYGFYAQDDWRVAARLTINMGLRYEFNTTPTEISGQEYAIRDHALDPAPTQGPPFLDKTYLNFSPRVGFAWDIFGDGKTSLRGAFGIYYDIANYGNLFVLNAFAEPPEVTVTQVLIPSSNQVINYTNGLPYTAANFATTIQGIPDYNDSQPNILQANLSLQRQLPGNTQLTVAYVHTRGAHLWSTGEGNNTTPTYVSPTGQQYWSDCLASASGSCASVPNAGCENVVPSCRANPAYTNIQLTSTLGDSWYNALQTSLSKRLSRGLEFQGTWTWSHSIDSTEGNIGLSTCSAVGMDQSSDPLHRIRDRAASCFDVRQNLRLNLLYHFPNIKSTGMLAKITNGWWIGNIVSISGGYPFTPVEGVNRSNSGVFENALSEKPDFGTATVAPGQIGPDGNLNTTSKTFIPFNAGSVITGNPNQWFNPLMFTLQPMVPCPNVPAQTCGTLGDIPRGLLRGPGLGDWDFSLVKDTPLRFLGEGGSMQIRGEFFNVLNRANFGTPNTTIFSGTTGTIGLAGCTTACANVGAYSESPLGTAGLITTTATTSRQVQLALKIIF